MIKIKNQRNIGYLFHYAHFITDCLFVEVINEVYKYDEVIRVKNINQTLGNFYKIYEEVMQMKNIELDEEDFDKINKDVIIYDKREVYANEYYFDKFNQLIHIFILTFHSQLITTLQNKFMNSFKMFYFLLGQMSHF